MSGDPGAPQKADNDLVLSFLRVRRAIGLLGGSLPFTLLLGAVLTRTGFLPSMSAYFYIPLREIFTGTLCANAVFFWSYQGYAPRPGEWLSDRLATRIAAISAATIALAPMLPPDGACHAASQCLFGSAPVGLVHFAAATVHFGTLAVISLVLFTRGDSRMAEKRASNRVYRACGWTIVAALAGLGALSFGPLPLRDALAPVRPVYLLEALATVAFAVSWLVKGDTLRPLVRAMAEEPLRQP